ncbi:MAG TPA: putative lipid II flippase FtsW [Candidatus Kryptonia bacterium]|nr:putative lipid II flippase FtsW [Candidatus Kryptonia bacterium]
MTRVLPHLRTLRQRIVTPRLNRPDWWLLIAAAGLVGLGVVMVFNASYFYALDRSGDPYLFFRKHVLAIAMGSVLAAGVSQLRFEVFERSAYLLLGLGLVAVVLVLIPHVGMVRGGARRWIGVGGFSIQPSEWVKIVLVMYLARSIARRGDKMASFTVGMLPHLIVIGIFAAIIVVQPDFGTAAILALLLIAMLFVGGARPMHLLGLGLAVLPVAIFGIVHEGYRMRRVLAFLDPWRYSNDIAFQLVQSLIAFGSGGVTGVGLGESKQKLFFLPEAHTDFIFALVGEELGLIGVLLTLSLFAVLGMRGFRIALRHPDRFASLLAFGITLVIMLEAVVNVGVVLGLLPTKGLALPFLSCGGSAMMVALVQVGILAALSRQTG